jgi:hypothetical protein
MPLLCRSTAAAADCATTVVDVTAAEPRRSEPDLAEELELRDELLLACREVLLGVGTRHASALVTHIDAARLG